MNYRKELLEGVDMLLDCLINPERIAMVAMFRRFILLMNEETFNRRFTEHFIDTKDFDEGWYDFHKSMRQIDFYDMGEGSGHVDMLFWNFIHATDIPYKLMKTFTEKIRIGKIGEFEDDIYEKDGWNKFGLIRALRYERQT